jgi:hypothetical protein
MAKDQIRVLAFYLPQYHPIPENNEWWGNGFTEWTNTVKAKPLFRGHHQPHLPADLGFYDLRCRESRIAQAELAKESGIEAFCYWHYWFGNGRRILERPFDEVLKTGEPDFPFCLAWANQSWTGIWHGVESNVLIEQKYPGKQDYIDHFNFALTAFRDERYIMVDNKPVFIVYTPNLIPDSKLFTDIWNEQAVKNGFDGVYFIGIHHINWDHEKDGFNEKSIHQPSHYVSNLGKIKPAGLIEKLRSKFKNNKPFIWDYKELTEMYDYKLFSNKKFIPMIVPNWDNTPRLGKNGWVFQNSTPEAYKKHLQETVDFVKSRPENNKFILLKSWNEWAEGNYVEPDQQWGDGFIKATQDVLNNK